MVSIHGFSTYVLLVEVEIRWFLVLYRAHNSKTDILVLLMT